MRQVPFQAVLRVLPSAARSELLALDQFVRHVQRAGHSHDSESALEALCRQVQQMYEGAAPECDEVLALRPLVQQHAVPVQPWLDLIEASRIDQPGHRYDTFEDVLSHCALSANPMGRIGLGVVERSSASRVALSDRVCTALRLIQHLRYLREDYLSGRVYLPRDDLRRFGVAESDLGRTRATPALAALVGYEADRAGCWLESGSILASTLHGWPRILVSGGISRGRVLIRQLEKQGFDPLAGVYRPTPTQIAGQWLHASMRSAG